MSKLSLVGGACLGRGLTIGAELSEDLLIWGYDSVIHASLVQGALAGSDPESVAARQQHYLHRGHLLDPIRTFPEHPLSWPEGPIRASS